MQDSERITLGEIHRLLLEVRADVKAQNGRVTALEKDAIRIKAYWSSAAFLLAVGGDWLKHKAGL